jgi:ribosomal protein L13E
VVRTGTKVRELQLNRNFTIPELRKRPVFIDALRNLWIAFDPRRPAFASRERLLDWDGKGQKQVSRI